MSSWLFELFMTPDHMRRYSVRITWAIVSAILGVFRVSTAFSLSFENIGDLGELKGWLSILGKSRGGTLCEGFENSGGVSVNLEEVQGWSEALNFVGKLTEEVFKSCLGDKRMPEGDKWGGVVEPRFNTPKSRSWPCKLHFHLSLQDICLLAIVFAYKQWLNGPNWILKPNLNFSLS